MKFTSIAYSAALLASLSSASPIAEPFKVPHLGSGAHRAHPAPKGGVGHHSAPHHSAEHAPKHTGGAHHASKTHAHASAEPTHETKHRGHTTSHHTTHHSSTHSHKSTATSSVTIRPFKWDRKVWPKHPIYEADAPTPGEVMTHKMMDSKKLPALSTIKKLKKYPHYAKDKKPSGSDSGDEKGSDHSAKKLERRAYTYLIPVEQGNCPHSYKDVLPFMQRPPTNHAMMMYGLNEDEIAQYAWGRRQIYAELMMYEDYRQYNHMCPDFNRYVTEAWASLLSGDVAVLLPVLPEAQEAFKKTKGTPPPYVGPPSFEESENSPGHKGKGKATDKSDQHDIDVIESRFKDITSWPRLLDGGANDWERYGWPMLQRNTAVCRVFRVDNEGGQPLLLMVRSSIKCGHHLGLAKTKPKGWFEWGAGMVPIVGPVAGPIVGTIMNSVFG